MLMGHTRKQERLLQDRGQKQYALFGAQYSGLTKVHHLSPTMAGRLSSMQQWSESVCASPYPRLATSLLPSTR